MALHFQYVSCYNLALNCSISLKFGVWVCYGYGCRIAYWWSPLTMKSKMGNGLRIFSL